MLELLYTDPNQNPPVRLTISNLEANISIVGIRASLKAIFLQAGIFTPSPRPYAD